MPPVLSKIPGVLTCPVCKDVCDRSNTNDNTGRVVAGTRCGHIFHFDCIKRWWETQRSQGQGMKCPLCNTEYNYHAVFEVFPNNETFIVETLVNGLKNEKLVLQSQLTTTKQELECLRTKYNEKLDELKAKNIHLNTYLRQLTNLEKEMSYNQTSLLIANSKCFQLQEQLKQEMVQKKVIQETLEARSKYFIKRLSGFTDPKYCGASGTRRTGNGNEIGDQVNENEALDLTVRNVSSVGHIQHSPQRRFISNP